MEYELRIYEAKDGELDAFVAEWQEQVVPLRRAAGFDVVGAWRTDDGRFVWILGIDGDFSAADAAYYESPVRRAVEPDSAISARTMISHQQRRERLGVSLFVGSATESCDRRWSRRPRLGDERTQDST